ncbi:MAG: hypothetical protein LBT86_06555 [Deltaproteobacteria bacterium]|jgi:hypothetical protein|nr:hypothetical protein [Deltaproteobacteria bacterium]
MSNESLSSFGISSNLSKFTKFIGDNYDEDDDEIISLLKDNDKISDLDIDSMSLAKYASSNIAERAILSFAFSDIDDYFEMVRISFIYDNREKVEIDCLVLEGLFWDSLKALISFGYGKDKKLGIPFSSYARPWAQFISVENVNIINIKETNQRKSNNNKSAKKADEKVKSAYYSVALSLEAYFAQNNTYTNSYNDLQSKAGLVLNNEINYNVIELYDDKSNKQPCFKFIVSHKSYNIKYLYDSCATNRATNLSN